MSNIIPSYSDPARTFHPGEGSSPNTSASSFLPHPQQTQGSYQPQQHDGQHGQQQYQQSSQSQHIQKPSFSSTSSNGLVHEEAHYTHPEQLNDTHAQHVPGLGNDVPVHTLNRAQSTASSNYPPPPQHYSQAPPPQQQQINTQTFAPTNVQPHYAPSSLNTTLDDRTPPPPRSPQQPESPRTAVVPGPALATPGQFLHSQSSVSPRASVDSAKRGAGTTSGHHLGPSGAQAGQLFPISAFVVKQSGAYSSHLIVHWRTTDGRAGQTERLGPSLGLGVAIRSLRNKGIPEGAHCQAYLDVTLGKSCLAPETFVYQELAPTCAFYTSGGTTLSKDKLALVYGDE